MHQWDPVTFCHSGRDSRDALQELRENGLRPKLFLTDPPYNMGFDYGEVNDSMEEDEYHAMLRGVFEAAYDAADDDSHLFIINYPDIIGRMWDEVIEPKTKGGQSRRRPYWKFKQWVTWCYPNNWPPSRTRFTRASRAIIWMTKGNPKQNIKQIVQPYRNPWDRRVKGLMEDEGKMGPALYDWWPQIDLCKNVSTDKVTDPPYSNQIPENLLRRIIHITTSPGDLVADPFAGTFSTVRAAIHTSRLGWGCDLNQETIIYHPKSSDFDPLYETIHDRIVDMQLFDIDWRSEPFDFERAGIDSNSFYKALAKGSEELPEKQRTLLLEEVNRLNEYSSSRDINNPVMMADPSLGTLRERDEVRQWLLTAPKLVLATILSNSGTEFNPRSRKATLVERVLDELLGQMPADSEPAAAD